LTKSRDPDFLARWSRRKQDSRSTENSAEPPDASSDEPVEAATEAELADKTDAEILEELGLPDPDDLEEGSDFSAFMARTVPQRIRTRALRKLWLTNPVLANLDELLDYGEDFTAAETVIENLQTAYQVGRGYLGDDDDDTTLDAPAERETEVDDERQPAEPEALASQDGPDEVGPEKAPSVDKEPDLVAGQGESSTAPTIPPRRRMRFHLTET